MTLIHMRIRKCKKIAPSQTDLRSFTTMTSNVEQKSYEYVTKVQKTLYTTKLRKDNSLYMYIIYNQIRFKT